MGSPICAQVPGGGSQPPACAAARLISFSPLNRSMKQWSANRGTRIWATWRSVVSNSSEPASRSLIRSSRRSRSGSRWASRRPASLTSTTMPSMSPDGPRSGTANSRRNTRVPSPRRAATVSSHGIPLSTWRDSSSALPSSPSGMSPTASSVRPASAEASPVRRSSRAACSFANCTLPSRSATMMPISAWLNTSSAGIGGTLVPARHRHAPVKAQVSWSLPGHEHV